MSEAKTIRIYGASDDLVEVTGDVRGCDEYGYYSGHAVVVCFPTGDRFAVHYGDRGVWEVTHENDTGKLSVQIEKAPSDDDPDPYTDTATVRGDIQRVECWGSWPPKIREVRDRVADRIDVMSDDEARRVWAVLAEEPRR